MIYGCKHKKQTSFNAASHYNTQCNGYDTDRKIVTRITFNMKGNRTFSQSAIDTFFCAVFGAWEGHTRYGPRRAGLYLNMIWLKNIPNCEENHFMKI